MYLLKNVTKDGKIVPHMVEKVVRYKDRPPLMEAFGVEHEIRSTLNRRVDLPSGGYIIIQEAEGLCAIDVNTGKFTGKRSQEETVTATNVEAAQEVARTPGQREAG